MNQDTGKCVGCQGPTNGYPYRGIGKGADGTWQAFEICERCHHEPPRPLKFHYFHVAQVEKALRRAGSSKLGV